MNAHGKYPESKSGEMVVKDLALNKGDCKRNKLITEFICEFN